MNILPHTPGHEEFMCLGIVSDRRLPTVWGLSQPHLDHSYLFFLSLRYASIIYRPALVPSSSPPYSCSAHWGVHFLMAH